MGNICAEFELSLSTISSSSLCGRVGAAGVAGSILVFVALVRCFRRLFFFGSAATSLPEGLALDDRACSCSNCLFLARVITPVPGAFLAVNDV